MIDTQGMITVAEAAKRLRLSQEQVRRKLRDGKLRGQRVGGQWFVEEQACGRVRPAPLIGQAVMAEIATIGKRIAERNPGYEFDSVEMVRRSRDERR